MKQKAGGLILTANPSFNDRRDQIIALAARHAVSTIYSGRDFIAAGGLIGYGNNLADAYRRVGNYTRRISRVTSQAISRLIGRLSLSWRLT